MMTKQRNQVRASPGEMKMRGQWEVNELSHRRWFPVRLEVVSSHAEGGFGHARGAAYRNLEAVSTP